MKCSDPNRWVQPVTRFTKREQRAILRLYQGQRLDARETAKRLHLNRYRVAHFLRVRGMLRHLGGLGVPKKLSITKWEELMTELPTATDKVLAQKYGVSHGRVREIRLQYGYPTGLISSSRAERRQAILTELSKQFGLTRQMTEKYIRGLGKEYQDLLPR